MGARYYDPEIGRFITPDSILGSLSRPTSLNRFIYCQNDPINLIDPKGLKGYKPMQEKWWAEHDETMIGYYYRITIMEQNDEIRAIDTDYYIHKPEWFLDDEGEFQGRGTIYESSWSIFKRFSLPYISVKVVDYGDWDWRAYYEVGISIGITDVIDLGDLGGIFGDIFGGVPIPHEGDIYTGFQSSDSGVSFSWEIGKIPDWMESLIIGWI